LQNGGRGDFPKPPPIKGHVIRMTYSQPSISNEYEGSGKLDTYYNYFIGKDSTKWASFVPLYREVVVKNVWAGIDVRYYFEPSSPPLAKGGQVGFSSLRYDFIVAPGADISQIRMQFEGQDDLFVNSDGELVIKTSVGDVSHSKLYAYQDVPDGLCRNKIECRFVVKADQSIGFEADGYNPALALVIDPLVWCTMIGGINEDFAWISSLGVDSLGCSLLAGHTYSIDYPISIGAYQTIKNRYADVVLSKFNSYGSDLIFSTFIGGYNLDRPTDISLDYDNNIYICGITSSSDFPVTTNCYQTTINGTTDGFVSKLNASGSALIFSTFIGGNQVDKPNCIKVDTAGCFFIAGSTTSLDYPTTLGAFQTTNHGPLLTFSPYYREAFITKFNPSGSQLVYSTYLGGSNLETITAIDLDEFGNAVVTGGTYSSDFPVTFNAYDTNYNGDSTLSQDDTLGFFGDVFVSKLNNNGTGLLFSTFIGGISLDQAYSLVLDKFGNIYVTGCTHSPNFPVTTGAYQTYFGDIEINDSTIWANGDVFITKLNSFGTTLLNSTYIGGLSFDFANIIRIDTNCNVYITGKTNSSEFPMTSDAFYSDYLNTPSSFITKLNPDLSEILYSSYLAGVPAGIGGLVVKDDGTYYVSGTTNERRFITTPGAFQTELSTDGTQIYGDNFVAKFGPCDGSATQQISTNSLYYTPFVCDTIALDTIWVRNSGDCILTLTSQKISGPDSTEFFWSYPPFLPAIVVPGDSIPVIIAFKPSNHSGTRSALLAYKGNFSTQPQLINLSAYQENLSFSIDNLDESNDTLFVD
jgi:hypothetical protein